jgi:hypothetical protein
MLRNARGNAIIEIVPILAIFILIVNFALGFFGLIHSGILASIGARNYAFETFRNRADLRYIRDTPESRLDFTYAKAELRFHVVRSEKSSGDDRFYATRRPIKFSELRGIADEKGLGERLKINSIVEGKKASEVGIEEGTNNAWIKTSYGICLTAKCGS